MMNTIGQFFCFVDKHTIGLLMEFLRLFIITIKKKGKKKWLFRIYVLSPSVLKIILSAEKKKKKKYIQTVCMKH